jgi:hypothetical protein
MRRDHQQGTDCKSTDGLVSVALTEAQDTNRSARLHSPRVLNGTDENAAQYLGKGSHVNAVGRV